MIRPARRLTREEAALWAAVAGTVKPLGKPGRRALVKAEAPVVTPPEPTLPVKRVRGRVPPALPLPPTPSSPPARILGQHGLDGSWERRLRKGALEPDFTLDLHGATLDAAHGRLGHGLTLALAQGARVMLLITGRSRPDAEPADRANRRGAIRAKFLDWLTNGPHASRIAAVRPAHPHHGGAGAVYIVLRRAPPKGNP